MTTNSHTPMSDEQAAGWVTIGRSSWVIPQYAVIVSLLLWIPSRIGISMGRSLGWGDLPSILLGVLLGLATVAAFFAYRHWLSPDLQVNLALGRIRAGRKSADLKDVVWAKLVATPTRRGRILSLSVGTDRKFGVSVVLRSKKGRTLPPPLTDLLVEALGRSNIVFPTSPHDPKGRFGRYNYPSNLTKEQVIALVAAPPTADEPLPVLATGE